MTTPAKPDIVNHPPHYTQGGIECIDAMRATLGYEGFLSYCRGAALKYIWRMGHKDEAKQEIRKAIWYLNRMVHEMEKKL